MPTLSPFQRLPPEIRYQIYEDLFPPCRVQIIRRKDVGPARKSHYRLYHRPCRIRDTQTQRVTGTSRTARRTASTLLALTMTCRVVYCETIFLLYSSMQFIFTSTKAVSRFLKTTRPDAQAAIQHIELSHIMYNEPKLTVNRIYKERSDRAWYDVCKLMAKATKSLRVLHFRLRIRDWPIRLQVGERWSLPLAEFGDREERLHYVDIQLKTPMFDRAEVQAVARELEATLMDPAEFQMREDERLARKLSPAKKARNVLRLVFDMS
ncbi:hypothetical protein FE257_003869 [Aspergillus nanangensis]|uniref:DUF7730 domain-containing protein n=1 Tax=Aspergillus nanangensis TaxID=2582783 RepID=A0AAD4GN82_ASPNN|nr:hypothetical protein FE257_003869 [Aspergillus nanangensis]